MCRRGGGHAPLSLRLSPHLMAWKAALDQPLVLSVYSASVMGQTSGPREHQSELFNPSMPVISSWYALEVRGKIR
jgi:hypothetical protein